MRPRCKGKKVGVSAFGSESDSAATMALKQLGLARSDVQIVEAGGTLKRLAALKSGALAATALNEPADTEAERERSAAARRSESRSALDFHRHRDGPELSRRTSATSATNFLHAYDRRDLSRALGSRAGQKNSRRTNSRGFLRPHWMRPMQISSARVPRDAEPSP